ncbi:uncharacterized protein LOC115034502 [Acyrthosiphon pisum]|uniref:Uncharacterized protein n=1 Tax=Acyrthosiphon pisum TaxID=7029 RepID=A0A8R2JW06_ACYPI|nr:uncharacterized protein LOC115034502 [Acyrthosiphon pisum]
MSFINNECTDLQATTSLAATSSENGSLKRRLERTSTATTKKQKTIKKAVSPSQVSNEELTTVHSEMNTVKLVNLKNWAAVNLNKNLEEEEDCLDFCEILFPSPMNEYSMLTMILIIFTVCPVKVIEKVIHPKQWMDTQIQSIWNEIMIMNSTTMTTLYNHLRKCMKTSLSNLDVNWLANLSLASTDISAQSLCQVGLAEFRNVCMNWTTLLHDIPRPISTSSQSTKTTYTLPTFVDTQAKLVSNPSSFEEHFEASTDDVDFVGFL